MRPQRIGAPGVRFARLWLAALALVGAACAATALAKAKPAAREGNVEMFMIRSALATRPRKIWVYTPPGYGALPDSAFGLVLAFDGGEYLTDIPLPQILDSLLAARATPPMIGVFVDDSSSTARLDDLANRAWFVNFIGEELIPWVHAHYRVSRNPRRAIITGSSAGGLAAVHIALRRPDLFGNVLSQSGAFWRGPEASNAPPYEWLTEQAAKWPTKPVRFWLEVGSTESRGAMQGQAPSILAANRALRDTLRAKGYDVTYTEIPGGVHAAETWAPRLPVGLAALAGQAKK